MHIFSSSAALGMLPSSTSSAGVGQDGQAKLKRMDTQDLKSKLATALGPNGKRYWSALLAFMTAKIDRTEFEEEAMMCLKPQHVHLHNSLVLGLLYNASADVPGPSTRLGSGMHHERDANGQLVDMDGNLVVRYADADDDDVELQMLQPAKKRIRLLTAGLSRKERARIRSIPKHLSHARSVGGGAASSLGWAGAGADMLEKKRKEEEKRRSAEEKRKAKESYSEIGAKDWRKTSLQSQMQVASVHESLSASTQQEIARALAAPLCVESKQLPDLEMMRDLMTLQAVEAGLSQGAQPQAAAMLLAALQSHLQNVTASIITKIRANRQMGIRVTGIQRTSLDDFAVVTDDNGQRIALEHGDESFDSASMAEQSPSFVNRPLRAAMFHDNSSISSSTASLGVLSAADSSMVSLASTAPTSLPAGSIASSENASNNGTSASDSNAGAVKGNGDAEDGDSADISMSSETSGQSRSMQSFVPKQNGPTTLELRHLSFLLDLAPHTVVEALGQGAQERLLAADWTNADEVAQRENENTVGGILQRQARLTASAKLSGVSQASNNANGQSSGNIASRNKFIVDQLAPIRLFDRRTLAETQAAALQKSKQQSGAWSTKTHPKKGGLSLPVTKADQQSQQDATDQLAGTGKANRQDGTGSADRRMSTSAAADENQVDLAAIIAARYGTGGQSGGVKVNASAAAHAAALAAASHHHRGQDPHLYDVVDPVALLASLVA